MGGERFPPRRPVVGRISSEDGSQGVGLAVHLGCDVRQGATVEVLVVVNGVVTRGVTLGGLCPYEVRVGRRQCPHRAERGDHTFFPEDLEHRGGPAGVGPVVEGQGDGRSSVGGGRLHQRGQRARLGDGGWGLPGGQPYGGDVGEEVRSDRSPAFPHLIAPLAQLNGPHHAGHIERCHEEPEHEHDSAGPEIGVAHTQCCRDPVTVRRI
jgi:hypothetical protein